MAKIVNNIHIKIRIFTDGDLFFCLTAKLHNYNKYIIILQIFVKKICILRTENVKDDMFCQIIDSKKVLIYILL